MEPATYGNGWTRPCTGSTPWRRAAA